MNRSVTARPKTKKARNALIALVPIGMLATTIVSAGPASAVVLPVTKKCTTTLNGVSQPSYNVDSMFVTRSYSGGRWVYKVDRSPNRTVTRTLSTGGTRYIDHHIDTIQMYDSGARYIGKTVNYPGNTTYFYSSYSGMDFYMKAHVTDAPNYEIFPTCRIYF